MTGPESIREAFRATAARVPSRTALVFLGERYSYSWVDGASDAHPASALTTDPSHAARGGAFDTEPMPARARRGS